MSRFKFTARTFMIIGACVMFAPLVLLYVIAGALGDGALVSPDGHLERYALQAQAGLMLAGAGAMVRFLGVMCPKI